MLSRDEVFYAISGALENNGAVEGVNSLGRIAEALERIAETLEEQTDQTKKI